MANNVTALPNSLLLLVHLHLLSYPHVNKPEYNENLFASTRGLRERTKTMEEISYFLVGRLERMKDGPKALFSTYPCSRPSDTVAFRTSLAKYLEQLRHGSLYTSTSVKSSNLKQNRKSAPIGGSAVWWKDVVIRKSLLEECSGERFERLMLGLSTHTLMKLSKSQPISDFVQELIRQPQLYTSKLLTLNLLRQGWNQKALYLDHRAEELERLRTQLSDSHQDGKLATSSTRQIQELAHSKLNHIRAAFWMGEEGAKALELSLTLAGLSMSTSPHNSPPTLSNQQKHDISTTTSFSVVPLPVAAAHHPLHLKKFRRSIFRPAESKVNGQSTKASSNHPAELQIQSFLQAQATMHATLVNAMAQLKLENEKLSDKLNNHTCSSSMPSAPPSGLLVRLDDNLLSKLTDSIVDELGTPDLVARLEHRIEEIRTSILPPYPVAQDPLPARLPALEPKVKPPTGIPQRLPPHNPTMNRKVSRTASPQKRSPRKSIRFSMARQARPRVSTLRVFSGGEEVNQLINSTNDLPSDNEGSDSELDLYGTPRSKTKTPISKQKINRIWTASTPGERPPSTLKHSRLTSRESFPNFMEAAVSLPSLLSAEGFFGADDVDDDEEGEGEEEEGQYVWRGAGSGEMGDELTTPRAKSFNLEHSDEEDVHVDDDGLEEASYEEEGSMTLKDMLLSSQANFVDLMGTQAMDLNDGDQCEDDSFKWDTLD